jgi:hypothetical protein
MNILHGSVERHAIGVICVMVTLLISNQTLTVQICYNAPVVHSARGIHLLSLIRECRLTVRLSVPIQSVTAMTSTQAVTAWKDTQSGFITPTSPHERTMIKHFETETSICRCREQFAIWSRRTSLI